MKESIKEACSLSPGFFPKQNVNEMQFMEQPGSALRNAAEHLTRMEKETWKPEFALFYPQIYLKSLLHNLDVHESQIFFSYISMGTILITRFFSLNL